MTLPSSEQPVAGPRRRSGSPRVGPFLLLVVLLAGGGLAWYLVQRPHLVFTNGLSAPIWMAVGQAPPASIPAGASSRVSLPRSGSVVVQWNLARPLSANQRPMGEELRGSLVLRDPRGTIRQSATTRVAGTEYFAPLITNATDQLLRVKVNAGLEGSVDCGCAVRPGATRVFVGYYRLYRNSTVQARDSAGRTATFRELGPQVSAADGTIGLRFQTKDLR